jgi:hypothetical protein
MADISLIMGQVRPAWCSGNRQMTANRFGCTIRFDTAAGVLVVFTRQRKVLQEMLRIERASGGHR